MEPKSVDTSRTQMTEYVLPQHANALGNVFGGQIMAWVDLCAAICAQRHSGRVAVTAFVDDLKFEQPVRVGEVVRLAAQVTAVFRTSLEIEVIASGEDSRKGHGRPQAPAGHRGGTKGPGRRRSPPRSAVVALSPRGPQKRPHEASSTQEHGSGERTDQGRSRR